MRKTTTTLRDADGGIKAADQSIASVEDVFALQGMSHAKVLESRFLR